MKKDGVETKSETTVISRGSIVEPPTYKLCNLQFKKPKFTPVIFHNLANYDCHLFIKNLRKSGHCIIKCIPNNEEKYNSFRKEIEVGCYTNKEGKHVRIKHEIRFIDSFKFMASSLDNLVNNLDHSNLKHTGKTCRAVRLTGIMPSLKDHR